MVQRDRLDEIGKAKRQIVDGSLTIWNERLTALVNAGDQRGALAQMLSPVELAAANNCDCNGTCAEPLLRGVGTPGTLAGGGGQSPTG